MPRGKPLRNSNGYGTIVKLSGKRRKPFEVRVNTRMDERYYPIYDVLGRFESRDTACIVLAEYNKNPYDIASRDLTFAQLYEKFYVDKYQNSGKIYSSSTISCTMAAYKHCSALYDIAYSKLRTDSFKLVLGQTSKGKALSHSTQEHIKNLFTQMDKFALQNDIIDKCYSTFATITVAEDDEAGVPFTATELEILWSHQHDPWVDTILIYIYSGWRVSELITIPIENIDLKEWLFKGGLKTVAGKNRVVPIHSRIQHLVQARLNPNSQGLLLYNGKVISTPTYTRCFKKALSDIGITTYHTPHDCRHTFTSLLDSAGANPICIDRLIGHASKTLTSKIYTHKDIEELRQAIELI